MRSSISTWVSLVALVAAGDVSAQAQSQNRSAAIVGCSEVGCPTQPGDASKHSCRVIDETFHEIGLANITIVGDDDVQKTLANLSWVQGNSITDYGFDGRPTERSLKRSYFLGTPYGLDLQDTRACAAFFYQPPDDTPSAAPDNAPGTCDRPMNQVCMNLLMKKAQELSIKEDEDPCRKLEEAVTRAYSTCPGAPPSKDEGSVVVRPIFGGSAPDVILSSDNITSNCWPVMPKEDDLTSIVKAERRTSNFGSAMMRESLNGTTHILTAFYGGRDSPLTKNAAQITCLKTVPASKLTDDDDDDDDSEASIASLTRISVITLLVAIMFSVV